MRDEKGTENMIAPICMYNAIYVRENKGIRCPSVTTDVSFLVDLCIDDSLLKKAF